MFALPLLLALGSTAPPLPLHHGQANAPNAWVARSGGHLWVCWDGPEPDDPRPDPGCWRRVPLEIAGRLAGLGDDADADVDPDASAERVEAGELDATLDLRVGFADASTLWVVSGPRGWLIGRDGLATAAIDAPLDLEIDVLAPQLCAAGGWLPVHDAGVWSWRRAPCGAPSPCRRRAPRIRRPGRAAGIHVELGLNLALARQVSVRRQRAATIGSSALITLTVGLDRRQAYRERELVRRWQTRHERDEGPPPPQARGALAELERAATERAQCRAWEVLR